MEMEGFPRRSQVVNLFLGKDAVRRNYSAGARPFHNHVHTSQHSTDDFIDEDGPLFSGLVGDSTILATLEPRTSEPPTDFQYWCQDEENGEKERVRPQVIQGRAELC